MTPQTLTLNELIAVHKLSVLAPEIALTLFALVVLLAGAFFPEGAQRRVLPALALFGVLASAFTAFALWNNRPEQFSVFGPEDSAIYIVDNFALFFKWIFLAGLAVTILISSRFLHARTGDRHTVIGEYYSLLMLSTVGMMFVSGARDLLVVFLGIETLSIALYVLAGFARARLMSNEAALKYFLLGSFASGFLLYGIALTYFATGTTLLPQIASNIADGRLHSPGLLWAGAALILIGLGFKAALVPFHQWTPDVYEGSPTPVTAFMAVGAKAAAFAALLRIFPGVFAGPGTGEQWHHILLWMAVLTMTVGNVVALAQDSVKRMLAYSSIAHAGYLLVGVLAAGSALRNSSAQGAEKATASVLVYLAIYAVMNLGAFAVLVYLENTRTASGDAEPDSEDANITMDGLRGLAWRQPLAAAALTVFLFSLAGIPPAAGFFGKLYIFLEAINQGLLGLVVVGVLNTVISVYYYLRPVAAMYMQGEGEAETVVTVSGDGTAAARSVSSLSTAVVLAIAVCAVAVLGMVVLQDLLMTWALGAARLMPPLG